MTLYINCCVREESRRIEDRQAGTGCFAEARWEFHGAEII